MLSVVLSFFFAVFCKVRYIITLYVLNVNQAYCHISAEPTLERSADNLVKLPLALLTYGSQIA